MVGFIAYFVSGWSSLAMAAFLKYLIFCVVGWQFCVSVSFGKPLDCKGIKIVSRQNWGWLSKAKGISMISPVDFVIVHHIKGKNCVTKKECKKVVYEIYKQHAMHTELKHMDMPYNFFIGGDGEIYEGRGWKKSGEHTFGWNQNSIGIAFIGEFSSEAPPIEMQNLAKKLILCGIAKGKITEDYSVHGNCDGDSSCYPCANDATYEAISGWPHWHMKEGFYNPCP